MGHLFWSVGWVVLIAIVGYFFILMYIIAPLKIKTQQIKDFKIAFVSIDLNELPSDFSEAFHDAASMLVRCGFKALGHLTRRVENTRQDSFVSIWANPLLIDSAQIIGVRSPVPGLGTKLVATLTTFRTEFTDGTSIVTSNTSSAGCFPPDRRVDVIRVAGTEDIELLYRFHKARVARGRGTRVPTLKRAIDPLRRMQFEHEDTFKRLIDAGYYYADKATESYQPTFKGAYMMTYRLLPPFKQIQRMIWNRAAERALAKLGFVGTAEFRNLQFAANSRDADV